MSKGSGCFVCRNSCNGRIEIPGWSYDCKLKIENSKFMEYEDCENCEEFKPQWGFQIGGYYTHMYFEPEITSSENFCMEWIIKSNGEFPRSDEDRDEWLQLHLCDFEQLEEFVQKWGKYFREKGIIKD